MSKRQSWAYIRDEMKNYLEDEKIIAGFLAVIALFLWVNFDPLLGGLYSGMIVLYLISIWTKMPKVQIWNNQYSIASSIAISGIVFLGYIILASFATSYINPELKFAFFDFSFLDTLSEKIEIPILTTNPTIRLLVYGIFVPIAESLFALSFLSMLWSKGLKESMQFDWKNIKTYWVAILVGISLAFFHFTTRQMSEYALITDAIFFGISVILVKYRGQLLDAILFHTYLNIGVLK